MPIRTTLHRLWGLVRPLRALPPTGDPSPPAPATPVTHDALTYGAVRFRVWTAGPYVVVATSPGEARKAFVSLRDDPDPAARAAADRMTSDERSPSRRAAAAV